MTTFRSMTDLWKAFNPTETAGSAMLENKENIIAVNQHQLYEQGIGKDGVKLKPYSKAYAKTKPRGIVDIYLTGKLQSEMNIRVENGEYEISSPAPYTPYVVAKRPNIFGLDAEGKQITWRVIQPSFVQTLKRETGCN